MFDKQLKPYYDGRVLANKSAMNDPIVQAVLKDMQARNWQDLPQPKCGYLVDFRQTLRTVTGSGITYKMPYYINSYPLIK